MASPKVAIILLNWNSWDETVECLESLNNIEYNNYEIIIVDNDSNDESIDKIKEYAEGELKPEPKFSSYNPANKPITVRHMTEEDIDSENEISNGINPNEPTEEIHLIESKKNRGFPGGCNLGTRYARQFDSDYYLYLNNDTVVDDRFLTELMKVAEDEKDVGVVGSKILDYEETNKIQSAGGKIVWPLGMVKVYGQNEIDQGQHDGIFERDYVWGTSVLVKKEVVDEIGYMDEAFFFGIEEYDYHTRARRAGFTVKYVSESVVWHKGGASAAHLSEHPNLLDQIDSMQGPFEVKYFYRLCKKHLPMGVFILPVIIRFIIHLVYSTFDNIIDLDGTGWG